MNRFFALIWLLGCALGASVAFAQAPLASYERANAALQQSVTAAPDDSVASLDALRQARTAFAPLAEELSPSLRRGLEETFRRAEQAIINESPTDLKVQTAVLRGGFQRSLYELALTQANADNVPRARTLLVVLADDLGLTPAAFEGDTRVALQTTFESRLAARSLEQLGTVTAAPNAGRNGRYETLATLYSQIFLVQDSPRLPAQTQTTVLAAITALIGGEPLGPALTTLRAQLQQFASAANAAQTAAPTPEMRATSGQAATSQAATEVAPQPPQEPASEPPAETAVAAAQPPASSSATAPTAQLPAMPSGPLGFLSGELRTPFLLAVGFLALAAVVQLLVRSSKSKTSWQDAALLLLLLPIVAEGFITLATVLAPRIGVPALASAASYSLFVNPTMQLVWLLLIACAVLCLALAWRAPPGAAVDAALAKTQKNQAAAAPPVAAPTPKPVAVKQAPGQASTASSSPTKRPLAAPGGLNWDEDF